MSEYTTGEGLSEEEEAMMMIAEEDPVTYNEVVKEKNGEMRWLKRLIR